MLGSEDVKEKWSLSVAHHNLVADSQSENQKQEEINMKTQKNKYPILVQVIRKSLINEMFFLAGFTHFQWEGIGA